MIGAPGISIGILLWFRFGQGKPQQHHAQSQSDRHGEKSDRITEPNDKLPEEPRTDRCGESRQCTEDALRQIEAPGAFRHVSDDQGRHHPDDGPSDPIQHLNYD